MMLNADESIRIVGVDSLKFDHYNVYTFEFKSGKKGKILQEKSSIQNTKIKKLLSQKIYSNFELCDVIEFKFDGEDGITLRGHGAESGIYEEGKLIIDLSNDAKIRYYKTC